MAIRCRGRCMSEHGRYYLTESGKKAYATPTSGGLFHVGIKSIA